MLIITIIVYILFSNLTGQFSSNLSIMADIDVQATKHAAMYDVSIIIPNICDYL